MTQRAFDRTTISCDHTFKISKYIGARRESDNKFVKQFENLCIVLNERHEVIGWRLTRTTSFGDCAFTAIVSQMRKTIERTDKR